MKTFSGKNNNKKIAKHIDNILEIIRQSLIRENENLEDYGYNFFDVSKEAHFLSIIQHALREKSYATVLEGSDTKNKEKDKIRTDMIIWYGKKWSEPINLEMKMIWATDRHDKIKSFMGDIAKLNNMDDNSPYICIGLYLYNRSYEKEKRRIPTEDIFEREYSVIVQELKKRNNKKIRHKIQNFDRDKRFDFPIYPPNDRDNEQEKWDRCRIIYCAKTFS